MMMIKIIAIKDDYCDANDNGSNNQGIDGNDHAAAAAADDDISNHRRIDCLLKPFVYAQIKENIKAPRHWPLWGLFTGDRWIPRTKGQ